MNITQTTVKTFNLKDKNDRNHLARDYATQGKTVNTDPVFEEAENGQFKFTGMRLMVDGQVSGEVSASFLSDVIYLEEFVRLVDNYKANPTAVRNTSNAGALGTSNRGKMSAALKEEIRELAANGMSAEDIATKTGRSINVVNTTLSTPVTA